MGKTLNLKDPIAHQLAQKVSELTGDSMTQAVVDSLRERLNRLESSSRQPGLVQAMEAAAKRIAALPILDHRSDDEILGYGEDGVLK